MENFKILTLRIMVINSKLKTFETGINFWRENVKFDGSKKIMNVGEETRRGPPGVGAST